MSRIGQDLAPQRRRPASAAWRWRPCSTSLLPPATCRCWARPRETSLPFACGDRDSGGRSTPAPGHNRHLLTAQRASILSPIHSHASQASSRELITERDPKSLPQHDPAIPRPLLSSRGCRGVDATIEAETDQQKQLLRPLRDTEVLLRSTSILLTSILDHSFLCTSRSSIV